MKFHPFRAAREAGMPDEPDYFDDNDDYDNFLDEIYAWRADFGTRLKALQTEKLEQHIAVGRIMMCHAAEDPLLLSTDEQAVVDRMDKTDARVNRLEGQYFSAQMNTVEEYVDEVDLSIYGRYIPRTARQLGPAFNRPRHAGFSDDPDTNANLLNQLPFVNREHMAYRSGKYSTPLIHLIGRIDFPLERIIGDNIFASWAGRGEEGVGPFGTIANGRGNWDIDENGELITGDSSCVRITRLAQDYPALAGSIDSSSVEMIADSAGEYWAISDGESSHRLAAAKLRGEDCFPVHHIWIHSDDVIDRLPFAVREIFADNRHRRASITPL